MTAQRKVALKPLPSNERKLHTNAARAHRPIRLKAKSDRLAFIALLSLFKFLIR